MKFLANENFPYPSVQLLLDKGFDVVAITKEMPGISDEEVMAFAKMENRIILTFDKDYGELIYKYGMKEPVSVVFYRYKGTDPEFAGTFLIDLLSESTVSLDNTFTVIDEKNIRQRKY